MSDERSTADPGWARPGTPLREVVDTRVRNLQARYRNNLSSGVSDLAALRRAVSMQPGADPRVWELTLAGVDVPAGAGDEPTAAEKAAHAALTLYAVHQQSQVKPMHVGGRGLGAAVRTLGRQVNEAAVRRRFEALGTAATFPELMTHARGLVTQLRSAGIPLDYGQLAQDFLALQTPSTAARVRLRWGRDYHRVRPAEPSTGSTDSPAPSKEIA
jgi:CRISPR system Cascade subunit CasB